MSDVFKKHVVTLDGIEVFENLSLKDYIVCVPGTFVPDREVALEAYKTNIRLRKVGKEPVIKGIQHGVLLRTENFLNFRIYRPERSDLAMLPFAFVFEVSQEGKITELDKMVEGPACIFENSVFNHDGLEWLKVLRGEQTIPEYEKTHFEGEI